MRVLTAAVLLVVSGLAAGPGDQQAPTIPALDEKSLREYTGAYRWEDNTFVYLQMWDVFSGFGKPGQLVAFDESGDVRVLYSSGRDEFFTGPGAGISTSVESRIVFERDNAGQPTRLTWRRDGSPPRTATRVNSETHEAVRFSSGDVQLAGTLIRPARAGKHPTIILVHGSGAENREYVLPFARFLVRHGVAVLGYDKRGVGESTGDWKTASYDELAGDVV